MRIAMIGSRGIPARAGGVERVVEELTRELAARGHEVLVYGRREYLSGAGEADAGKVIVTPGLRGKHLETVSHTATAMRDVLGRGVDVVHVHSPGPALLAWLARPARLPVVLTVHAPDWRREKWSPPARLALRLGLRCGMRIADAVTTVSAPLAEELSAKFGRQVTHVPNAVRPVEPDMSEIERCSLSVGDYVLCVGRIVPEKRLDLLLDAWQQVRSDRKLVVVGQLDDSGYCRRCRLLAGGNVLFLGAKFGAALAGLYAGAALVVQPSVLEGMSLVLLEAASYGRCILAADIPENRALMGDSILYFNRDRIDELGAQIRRSLEQDGLRGEFGRKAKSRVRRCTWSEVASAMEKLYNSVVQGRH